MALIGEYLLGEGTGSTANDTGSANADMTLHGPTWVASYGLSFDGVDDYCDTPGDVAAFDIARPFTYSAWVKLTATSGCIISHISTAGGFNGAELAISDGGAGSHPGEPSFYNTAGWTNASVTVNDGSWHHIAFVVDSSGNYVWYVDGTSVRTGSGVISPTDSTDNVRIGRRESGVLPFSGEITKIRIHDTALSSGAISTLFAEGAATSAGSAPNFTYGGTPYSFPVGSAITTITPTNSGDPAASSVLTAGTLPLGLTLNADGTITGTPTQIGTFSGLGVTGTNSGGTGSQSATFSITITVPSGGGGGGGSLVDGGLVR